MDNLRQAGAFAARSPLFLRPTARQKRPPFAEKGEPDALEKHHNQEDLAGNHGEAGGGRLTAAEEDYLARAYPATEIPFSLTQNASAAFDQVRGRGQGRNIGRWVLVGPSTATQPGVLDFTDAETITSRQNANRPACRI